MLSRCHCLDPFSRPQEEIQCILVNILEIKGVRMGKEISRGNIFSSGKKAKTILLQIQCSSVREKYIVIFRDI